MNVKITLVAALLSTLVAVSAQSATPVVKYTTTVWSQGVFQADSFTVAMTRAKAQVTVGQNVGFVEYDYTKSRLNRAYFARNFTPGTTQVQFGQFFVPSGNDFPAPTDDDLCRDDLFGVQAGLFDRGVLVASHAYKGKINASAAMINGNGITGTPRNSHRPVFDGNVNIGTGPYYASFNCRMSTSIRYTWAVAQVMSHGFTFRFHNMRNESLGPKYLDRQIQAVDLEYHFADAPVHLGLHASKQGYKEASVELNLGGKNRMVATFTRNHDVNAGRLMVQGLWGHSN